MAAPGDVTDPDALKDLAAARKATAKYQDVSVASAGGYFSTFECVEVPVLGGMGIHYVNFGLMPPPSKPHDTRGTALCSQSRWWDETGRRGVLCALRGTIRAHALRPTDGWSHGRRA